MSKKTILRIVDGLVFLVVIIILGFAIKFALWDKEVALAFSLGALGISGANLYLTVLRPRFIMRPSLNWEIDIQPSPPTSDEVKNYSAKMSWFMRLKIVNNGLTPAKNCVGRLVEVRDKDGKRFDRFDPFNLYWARQNDLNNFRPIDIQGNGDFFFLDVAQVKEAEKEYPICLRVVTPGGRLVLDSNPGEGPNLPSSIYDVCIGIYAEDATYIEPAWFTITCETNYSIDRPPKFDFK